MCFLAKLMPLNTHDRLEGILYVAPHLLVSGEFIALFRGGAYDAKLIPLQRLDGACDPDGFPGILNKKCGFYNTKTDGLFSLMRMLWLRLHFEFHPVIVI